MYWHMARLTDTQLILLMEACMGSMERCKKRIEDAKDRRDHAAAHWGQQMLNQYTESLDRLLEEMDSRNIQAEGLPHGNSTSARHLEATKEAGERCVSS